MNTSDRDTRFGSSATGNQPVKHFSNVKRQKGKRGQGKVKAASVVATLIADGDTEDADGGARISSRSRSEGALEYEPVVEAGHKTTDIRELAM